MNPTPQELWIAFADAIQDVVGHQRSIDPRQTPVKDAELYALHTNINGIFQRWIDQIGEDNGTSK